MKAFSSSSRLTSQYSSRHGGLAPRMTNLGPARNWSQSLQRMASFTSYCSSMTQRRSQDLKVDRGKKWYKAVTHHLRHLFKYWHRQTKVLRMNTLLETWYLRHSIQTWQDRLNDNNKLLRALTLWSKAKVMSAFKTWLYRTNRGAAITLLANAVRRSILSSRLRFWRQRNMMMRWRLCVHQRYFNVWYDWYHLRKTQRNVLQQCLQSMYIRSTRSAFTKWHVQYLFLQAEYDKQKQFEGTSLDRLMKCRSIRRCWRTWIERTIYLTHVYTTLNGMMQVLNKHVLQMGWLQWQKFMFKWQRKRRKACGCAKALATSRKGIGWCYKCTSLDHLQNRIEDSVELVEGMAFRLVKTALSTQDQNMKSNKRTGRSTKKSKSNNNNRKKNKTSNRKMHAGEQALDRLLLLLQCDREDSSSDYVSLRSIAEHDARIDEYDDCNDNYDATATVGEEEEDEEEIDLETTIGLKTLSLRNENGIVERSFVSRSARESHDRFNVQEEEEKNKTTETSDRTREDKPWIDGFKGRNRRTGW